MKQQGMAEAVAEKTVQDMKQQWVAEAVTKKTVESRAGKQMMVWMRGE